MTAINFPDSPSVGDLYTINGRTWKWSGIAWISASVSEIETLDGGDPETSIWGGLLDAGAP